MKIHLNKTVTYIAAIIIVCVISLSSPTYLFALNYRYENEFIGSFGGFGIGRSKFNNPVDIVVDSDKNIYVLDQGNSRIQKFDKYGHYILEWGRKGSRDGEFFLPVSLYMDSDENIYVFDSLNHRIQKFDTDGNFLTSIGILGTREGRFNAPYNMGVDRHGKIYVADTKNNRIQKFNSSWTFEEEFGRLGVIRERITAPSSINFIQYKFGYMYVTSFANCNITRYTVRENDYEDVITLTPVEPESADADDDNDYDDEDDDDDVADDDEMEEGDAADDDEMEEGDEYAEEDDDVADDDEMEEEEDDDDDEVRCGIKRLAVLDIEMDDYLLVIFNGYDGIYVYDYDGNYVEVLTEGKYKFKKPSAVYVKDREIYVVDSGNNFVHKFRKR